MCGAGTSHIDFQLGEHGTRSRLEIWAIFLSFAMLSRLSIILVGHEKVPQLASSVDIVTVITFQ